jgi:hypothetical protein
LFCVLLKYSTATAIFVPNSCDKSGTSIPKFRISAMRFSAGVHPRTALKNRHQMKQNTLFDLEDLVVNLIE